MPKQKPSTPQAARSSAGQQALAKTINDNAQRRTLEQNEAGRFMAKITPEEWDWAIEQVRGGDTDANICRHLGLHKASMAVKRRQDPVFRDRYMEALEDAFTMIAQETRDVARGAEGYSTGDVQRDRLVVETDLKLASKFARKILGDKLDVEVKSLNIILKGDDGELC